MKIGLCFLVLCARPMLPQVPQFTAAGVVNAFSYAQPVSPGSLVSLFGTDLATAAASATSIPLPLKLGGTSVTVNGVNAPLLFVSPRQINFQLPSVVGTQDSAYVTTASVVITTPAGSSEAVEAPVFASGPAIATSTQNGCGQAAALNVARDGTVSLNSPTNSAARGDYISLYGTGLGVSIAQPPDGTALPYGLGVEFEPGVWLDGYIATVVPFAGLAPDLVGVDQVNVQIPQYVREGCAVPVAIEAGALISPLATISIHDGRGKCVDPPVESFGRISLVKTVASGTGNDGETDTLTARFPSGPGIERPSSQIILGCCFYNDLNPTPVSRACPLPGNADLSAGLITVQGNGTTINAEPQPSVQGTTYQQALPSGFIAPGQYQFSASGGPVQFNGELLVGPPIQIQTSLSPGTMISDMESFTITWTGGQPGTLVKASLSTPAGIYAAFDYAYVDATDGSFSFVPYCTDEGATQMYCTYTIGTSNNAQVVIEVFPSPDEVNEITAQGLTDGIKMSWMYRYIFGGLILN